MPGTLTIGTISDGTNSTSATNCIQGSAKAWVNFNGSTAAIRASYNVSSVTRTATGQYTVNIQNALSDANYAVVVGGNRTAGSASDNLATSFWSPSTSSVSVSTAGPVSVGFYDANIVSVAIFR